MGTLFVFCTVSYCEICKILDSNSAIKEFLRKQTYVKMDRIVSGNYRCSVSGCLTTLKTKQENEHLFAIPQNISEDWRNVLRKPQNWLPKKNSKICSKHFTPGDINGRRLRPGAIPPPTFPTLFVASGNIFYNG